jgi:hypothetical protein
MAIGVQQTRAAAEVKPNVMVSLVQLNTELHGLRVDLSRTMTALEGVKTAAKKNEELIKPFAAFSSAYGELEAQVAKVRQYAITTKVRAKEHWDAWQQELTDMENAKLREKAQKRFTATSTEFQKISDEVSDAKEVFAPLVADLKDIHTYLSADLSRDAVSSLSNTIWKMGNQAHSADSRLMDVSKQIERTMNKLPQK